MEPNAAPCARPARTVAECIAEPRHAGPLDGAARVGTAEEDERVVHHQVITPQAAARGRPVMRLADLVRVSRAVAFDGIQASPRYPAGLALRFARVKRYRTDKRAGEADTVETVRRIFARQQG